MKTYRVDTYNDVEAALCQNDLTQALSDEGGILMDKVLVMLYGEEHRNRRAVESQFFRRNFFATMKMMCFLFFWMKLLSSFLITPRSI